MPRYVKKWWEDAQQFKIEFIEIEDVERFLKKCRNPEERVFLLLLYYTGARPSELLETLPQNISLEEKEIIIKLPTKKGGVGRPFPLPINDYTLEILNYFQSKKQNEKLFSFKNSMRTKEFIYRITDNQLTQYFFRHNRFSKIREAGGRTEDIKMLKGAKDIASVEPYLHFGTHEVKKLTKFIK